ncbi:NRDE family protein [Aureibaculum sp. 2210JD6-5]|uniref:NRDE family protein n=1 Tax=Aureibaculum sp. 2210JD6-5 TaxID=3103957 RepID=UPI002AAEEC00|nr:NRDE family protein [Aureibaculum sp. 2210JD6-5]MDY7397014.1 NRDE family protein [Aureibaculum sp. 2210JD6-5]
MCTVSFLPLNKTDFILTSSRDIPFSRKKALHPKEYVEDGVKLWYPKDGKAGGSWIGTSSKKRLICLLNGGYVYHTSLANYKKSRGLIVKELLKADDIRKGLNVVDLDGVEQFTLVIVDWNPDNYWDGLKLLEFVWDGEEKHLKEMPMAPQIWSSSTLYDADVKQMRVNWFKQWLRENEISQESILKFHHTAGVGDPNIDIMMDRKKGGTVSITSIKKEKNNLGMVYEDVIDNKKTELLIELGNSN